MSFKIPTSEKLESSEKDLANYKVLASTAKADLFRQTTLVREDSYSTTVINREEPATHATFGMRDAPSVNRPIVSDVDEAKRREDDRERILRGEPLAPVQADAKSQIDQTHRRCRAIDDAIESTVRDINREKAVVAAEYCRTLKPEHDSKLKRLFAALLEVHAAHSDLSALRQHLVDNDLGFRGICLLMPDSFLGHPLDKYSDMAEFLRAGKREGFIAKLPAVLV
jgi:hypothetical protein